jgi:hypothetical protein
MRHKMSYIDTSSLKSSVASVCHRKQEEWVMPIWIPLAIIAILKAIEVGQSRKDGKDRK